MKEEMLWASEAAKALVMITSKGFYLIDALAEPSLKQQAEDHGTLNDHVIRVEDMSGKVLWVRA